MKNDNQKKETKNQFAILLSEFVSKLSSHVCTEDGQWAVKGFIDAYRKVYSISSDSKVTSKILEIHIFPLLLEFADNNGYALELAEHQNHYPDMTFIKKDNSEIKFAVDLKSTYRKPDKQHLCNGFTLGSYAGYFSNRNNKKNILYPYSDYSAHFCLGLIYDRALSATIDETQVVNIENVEEIASVMSNMQFFVAEKWQLASDRKGSGNTANIGSISLVEDIINKQGMFANLGEGCFDEYWMNFGKLQVPDNNGGFKPLSKLIELIKYKRGNESLILPKRTKV